MTRLPLVTAPHEETIPVFNRRVGSWRFCIQRHPYDLDQLTRRYDRAAAGWARKLAGFGFPEAYAGLFRRVFHDHPLPHGQGLRVLDCGIGTGALSQALAQTAPLPLELVGMDISARMLERAGRLLGQHGLQPQLHQGDIRNLPQDDDTFDIVISAHVLEHLPDPLTALAEMVRVLKPGGLLICCLTRRSTMGALIHLLWRTHRLSTGEAKDWFHRAGLGEVRSYSFEENGLCRNLSLGCVGRKPSGSPISPAAQNSRADPSCWQPNPRPVP